MPRPLRRPVKVVLFLSEEGAAWIDKRREDRTRSEYIRGMMQLAKKRVDVGIAVPAVEDDEPADATREARPVPKEGAR